jgi:V/A-type H+-transporting ATPase subunit I
MLPSTAWHVASELREHGHAVLGSMATEFFHGALSLLTNTLSFLRLAAFALNHGALSMALFLVVEQLPVGPLGWVLRGLVLVAGSAVILVLDVLVVAVQTVRLEFYEGLTRYFRGDGKEFLPLRFPEGKTP